MGDKMGTNFTMPAPKKFVTAKKSSKFFRYAVIGCKLKNRNHYVNHLLTYLLTYLQNASECCNSYATVVQVLQDLFYVLLHV